MIKKRVFFLSALFVFFICFFGAAAEGREGLFYIPDMDEMSFFIESQSFLKKAENGKTSLSDAQFKNIYSREIGQDFFSSMLYENFFRVTENETLKKQLKTYIKKENLETDYAKTLLKKLDSEKKVYEKDGKKSIRYSYKNKEFDENINLFDFVEVHPFKDEFGMLLFNNDWDILTYTSEGSGQKENNKDIFLIYGGNTNSITVRITEYENIVNEDDLQKVFKNEFYEKKYPDAWYFMELDKEGILETCGAERYFVGCGKGPDLIPEIDCGTFNGFLYNKAMQKVFSVSFFMNFSQINMNYEIRDRLFDYVRFFTLFCFCD